MSSPRILLAALAALVLSAGLAAAQMTGLARLDPGASRVADDGAGVSVDLALSQPVPWRVFTLDDPPRLVVDFREVLFPPALTSGTPRVPTIRMGRSGTGWSRLVLSLAGPFGVDRADMETQGADGARVRIRLVPVSAAAFAGAAGLPGDHGGQRPQARPAPTKEDPRLHVMLDPGHGGVDPGAQAGDLVEAPLMLRFARELRDLLLRADGFRVSLTREDDSFVSLERRITLARTAGADVLLSLHADALSEDAAQASGATVYTLSDKATDAASRLLAERHDQSDLLAGVDLAGQSDEIAIVLMDIARQDTQPRAEALADILADHLLAEAGAAGTNSRPRRSAAFSVLKAPDIPSVLVELGFLSSERDRARLVDPEHRTRLAAAIRDALQVWASEDALRQSLIRQ